MKCPSCGNENEPGAQFCGICGTGLASVEVVTGPEQPMVTFGEAISRGFKNYANFNGRATRAEFWWFSLFIALVDFAMSTIDTFLGLGSFGLGMLHWLWFIATILPTVAVAARRLHDINKSGWWQLLDFAIIVGWIIQVVWLIRQGDKGPNKYGPDPRTTPRS